MAYAAIYALATWQWTFALIGIGLRYFSEPSQPLRYLADSSYWLYLIHLPVVFMAQAAMMRWNAH
jgi:glucan biosynthesis protein C